LCTRDRCGEQEKEHRDAGTHGGLAHREVWVCAVAVQCGKWPRTGRRRQRQSEDIPAYNSSGHQPQAGAADHKPQMHMPQSADRRPHSSVGIYARVSSAG
jgi:hypothetical protein